MCVSSELGQKGRDWKQWAGDKAADKSTLLSLFVWEFRLVSSLLPFFVPALYSNAVLPVRFTDEWKRNPGGGTGLVFHNGSNPGPSCCLVHKGIVFCGLKVETRREILHIDLVSFTSSSVGE